MEFQTTKCQSGGQGFSFCLEQGSSAQVSPCNLTSACLAYADMITLSSPSALTMMFNTILAIKMVDENFTRYDFASTALISIGATICVLFSHYDPIQYSYKDFLVLMTSLASLLFFFCFVFMLAIGIIYSRK